MYLIYVLNQQLSKKFKLIGISEFNNLSNILTFPRMGSGSSLISGTQYIEYLTKIEGKVWSQKSNSRLLL